MITNLSVGLRPPYHGSEWGPVHEHAKAGAYQSYNRDFHVKPIDGKCRRCEHDSKKPNVQNCDQLRGFNLQRVT
jgi:hypothetical protein